MFADDTNLFISDSNIKNLFKTMNEELRKVADWFKANKPSLNISKTKYSLFHSTRKRKDIPNRRVTRGEKRGGLLCPFPKFKEKCPDFAKNALTWFIYGFNFSFKMLF